MPATLKPRKSRAPKSLNPRAKKLVKNLASQKFATRKQALVAAGYSPNTSASSVLNRPLVKSALTDAMQALGISHTELLQPIKDALKATRSYIHPTKGLINSTVPDHKIRLEASRDAVAILGGIPKVGEGTPNAHGLNLFVAVDNGGGTRVQVSAHAARSETPHPSKPTNSVTVQIKDEGPRNVQAPRLVLPSSSDPRPGDPPVHVVVSPPDLLHDAPDPALNG
jgi:hypothetical protein